MTIVVLDKESCIAVDSSLRTAWLGWLVCLWYRGWASNGWNQMIEWRSIDLFLSSRLLFFSFLEMVRFASSPEVVAAMQLMKGMEYKCRVYRPPISKSKRKSLLNCTSSDIVLIMWENMQLYRPILSLQRIGGHCVGGPHELQLATHVVGWSWLEEWSKKYWMVRNLLRASIRHP